MLSQKVKEKLETENVCASVIISIRDDIEEMEREYLAVLQEVKKMNKAFKDWQIYLGGE